MSDDTNKAGNEMRGNAAEDMNNVHAIGTHVDLTRRDKPSFLVRLALYTGFMNNPNEPTINGTNIIFAIVILAGVIYFLVNWGVGRLDEKDLERGKYAIMYSTANKASTRADMEAQKRAELLEIMKKEGLYEKVPEKLKTFDSPEVEKTNLVENKP